MSECNFCCNSRRSHQNQRLRLQWMLLIDFNHNSQFSYYTSLKHTEIVIGWLLLSFQSKLPPSKRIQLQCFNLKTVSISKNGSILKSFPKWSTVKQILKAAYFHKNYFLQTKEKIIQKVSCTTELNCNFRATCKHGIL